ncbi:anti-sigma factor [Bacillus phage W.Ph.]|uniref:Gp52 n=1 Tax=Bacillus phage W.Ph. TaxID=764595 RepID=G9B1F3_9CAUD|nr:anti-sigma factor [Bacillus phage W.Ph.]ADH03198.1 gp52 [Bacillus phage W.Ph.]
MKIKNHSVESIELVLENTNKEKDNVSYFFPKQNMIFWYPLNNGYEYKHSDARGFMYLTKDKLATVDVYKVVRAKRAKKLPQKNGIPFSQDIFNKNLSTLKWAKQNGYVEYDRNYIFTGDYDNSIRNLLTDLRSLESVLKSRYYSKYLPVADDITADKAELEFHEVATAAEKNRIRLFGETYAYLRMSARAGVTNV